MESPATQASSSLIYHARNMIEDVSAQMTPLAAVAAAPEVLDTMDASPLADPRIVNCFQEPYPAPGGRHVSTGQPPAGHCDSVAAPMSPPVAVPLQSAVVYVCSVSLPSARSHGGDTKNQNDLLESQCACPLRGLYWTN
jgi:hypothetical protein